ncbi:MAG TPA: methyltransferase domain-containing protein [Verrucomicrobiae bacterium]|nr:methyltransferase domain-containing protein [Verrucomicrobiae bacterium]
MRLRHFETLRPVCPVCRGAGHGDFPLRIAQVCRERQGDVLEGVLHCGNTDCRREYPIIDGIPLLIGNLRQYVADNFGLISMRRDISPLIESILGDCCGPGSAFDQTRQQISSYVWEHYGDLDPGFATGEFKPGSMMESLQAGLELAATLQAGPIIDLGCSVGRSSLALAEAGSELVLGVDLNYPMLRFASEVLHEGTVRYPLRRAGLVYERREFATRFAHPEQVDFWACDATALPLPADTFALAVNLNVLDCVSSPRELLVSIGRLLKEGGKAILTCPYDWSPTATALEAWVGGHSQRGPLGGSCEAVLRALLTPGAHPGSLTTLKLVAEREKLPWRLRLHDRSTMNYEVHLVIAQRASLKL